MALAELLVAAGAGWAVTKAADAVTAPLKGLADDIDIRLAISSALERTAARLPELFDEEAQAKLVDILDERQGVVFTLILERLRNPPLSPLMRGGLSAELAWVLGARSGEASDMLKMLTDLIDSELWAKPPLVTYRKILSDYVNEQRLAHLLERLAPDMSAAAVAARVRFAAKADIAKRLGKVHEEGLILERRVSELKSDASASQPLDALTAHLGPGWRGALIDQGGAGKTTALLTLGTSVFSQSDDLAAVYLPMAEVALHRSLFTALLQRDAFIAENISLADLAAQARNDELVILLDGWNELSIEGRRLSRSAVTAFHSDYPNAGLVFASRPFWSSLPVSVQASFGLDRVSFDDQKRYVESINGAAGVGAHAGVRDHRELLDLLGIPFFLNLFARLNWQNGNGDLPKNSVELVARFVEGEFSRPAYLDPPPGGAAEFVRALLVALAIEMVEAGSVEIPVDAARVVIRRQLTEAGFTSDAADCERVLQRLSEQSLVHVVGEGEQRRLAFDHQLLRDWFASFHVRDAISESASDTATPSSALSVFGDVRVWEGATEIAVEALGASGPIDPGLRRFLLEVCGIDPQFAATLMCRISDEAWIGISEEVEVFVETWRDQGPGPEVFSFMVGTGRPQFADRIFDDLFSETDQQRERQLRRKGGFLPEVLGPDWQAKGARMPNEQRRMLVHDLAYSGGDLGLDMAIELSANDLETDHLGFVLDELFFYGREDKAAQLIAAMSDAAVDKWALDSRYGDVVAKADPARYRATLEQIVEKGADSPDGVRARMALSTLDGEQMSPELIEAGLTLDDADKDLRHWHLRQFADTAPDTLSQVLLVRMKAGQVVFRLHEHITKVSDAEANDILAFLLDEERDRQFEIGMATHLKVGQVRRLLTDALSLCQALEGKDNQQMRDERNWLGRLERILRNVNESHLTQVLRMTQVRTKAEAVFLLELVRDWKGAGRDNERGLSPTGMAQSGLYRAIERWVRCLLAASDKTCAELEAALRALAQPGLVAALPLMREVHEAELALYEIEHADNPARLRLRGGTIFDHRRREPFTRHLWPEAKDLLLGYIGDERFELGAAIALRAFAPFITSDIQDKGTFLGRSSYEVRLERRGAFLERETSETCDLIPARLLDRIKEIDLEREDGWARVRSLAASAAWMDCGPRIDEVIALIERDPEPVKSKPTLEALAEIGHPLKADWIIPGLAAAEAIYFEKDWRSQNEFYILRPWLELMARSDRPQELIDRKEQYPLELGQWNAADFIPLLALEDKDAMVDAIEAFHSKCQYRNGDFERVRALFQVGSDRSLSLLIDDVLAGRYSSQLHFGYHGPNELAKLLERDPDRLRAAVAHLATHDDAKFSGAHRLGRLCRGASTEKLFEIALEESEEGAAAPIWRVLVEHMLESQCTLYEPLGQGSYELHDKPVGALRQNLYARAASEPDEPFWARLLTRVDRIASKYGGHPDDLRHPDLKSGLAYPEIDPSLWKSVGEQ